MLIPHWWTLVLRGLFGIAFGLLALFMPGITLMVLVVLFGAYALADGIMALISGVSTARRQERWWPFIVEGLFGIAAGVTTFAWPGITALVLLYVIAGWAFVTGIFEIAAAIRLRRQIGHEWLLALSGALSIAFGVILAMNPASGALAVVTIIGIYGVAFGAMLLGVGLRLRHTIERVVLTRPPTTTPQPV